MSESRSRINQENNQENNLIIVSRENDNCSCTLAGPSVSNM